VPVIRRTSIHMVMAKKPMKPRTTSKVCSHRGKGSDTKVLPISKGENAIRRCRSVWLPHQLALTHSRSIMVRSRSSSDICWIYAGKPRAARVRWLITPSVQERLGWVRVERTAPSRRVEQCSRGAPALWLLAWGAEIKASCRWTRPAKFFPATLSSKP